jgi:hypothetical protein
VLIERELEGADAVKRAHWRDAAAVSSAVTVAPAAVAPQAPAAGVGDLAQFMRALQARLAEVAAQRSYLTGLEKRRDECAARAEAALNEAGAIEAEAATVRKALDAPELRQAVAAAEAFRAMGAQ